MGNIAVSDQGDDRSLAIDHLDRTNHRFSFIACGIGCGVCDLVNAWSVVIDGTVSFNASIAIYEVGPVGTLIHIGHGCDVSDIGIPDPSDHRWGGIDHFNGPVYIHCGIATGIGKGVSEGIDSGDIFVHRAVGICCSITIHGIIPICTVIDVCGSCFVSNVTVSQ